MGKFTIAVMQPTIDYLSFTDHEKLDKLMGSEIWMKVEIELNNGQPFNYYRRYENEVDNDNLTE